MYFGLIGDKICWSDKEQPVQLNPIATKSHQLLVERILLEFLESSILSQDRKSICIPLWFFKQLFLLPQVFVICIIFAILTCFHLTNFFGEEKINWLPSKNKVADENLHFQRHTNFLVKIQCLVLELFFNSYFASKLNVSSPKRISSNESRSV